MVIFTSLPLQLRGKGPGTDKMGGCVGPRTGLNSFGSINIYNRYEEWNRSVLLTEYCAGGKIEKNEMGRACGAYGGGERGVQGSDGET